MSFLLFNTCEGDKGTKTNHKSTNVRLPLLQTFYILSVRNIKALKRSLTMCSPSLPRVGSCTSAAEIGPLFSCSLDFLS